MKNIIKNFQMVFKSSNIFGKRLLSAWALLSILTTSYGLDQNLTPPDNHATYEISTDLLSQPTHHLQAQDVSKDFFAFLKGQTPENALYISMFTWHFNPESRRDDRWVNNLIGLLYNNVFFGTFLNSFNERAFVFGVQRNFYMHRFMNDIAFDLGYRLGVISGYDERMSSFANYSPVMPLLEAYIDFSYKYIGVEVSYIGVVLTTKFFIMF